MSILNIFKKPNWKNKDNSIRAQAVSHDTSPELKAQLSSISQNDESELVRTAAVRRLNDYELLAKIAENDAHKTVKMAAYKIIQDWIKNTKDENQLAIIKQISNLKTI